MKKLTKVGNSLALVIDQPIFELLDLDDQTPLEVTTDGHRLTISPATTVDGQAGRKQKNEEALARGTRCRRARSPG